MIGAIIGDISGSRFEWDNHKSKEFELLAKDCGPTDDSNMTLWIAMLVLLILGLAGFNLSRFRTRKRTKSGTRKP